MLSLVAVVFFSFATYMLVYHVYLVCTNTTTNEDIKGLHRPFSLVRYLRYRLAVERLWECSKGTLLSL